MAADGPFLIALLGGGLTAYGDLPLHTQLRVEKAMQVFDRLIAEGTERTRIFFASLSYGTPHKPNPVSPTDQMPILESEAGARALIQKGVAPEQILLESLSRDTIGNAVFLRLLHTEVRGIRQLAVVTNDWHFPRTQAIFDLVFSLPMDKTRPIATSRYQLTYEVAESGLEPEVHRGRAEREDQSRLTWIKNSAAFVDIVDLHCWLFSQHNAYSAAPNTPSTQLDSATLQSY